MRNNFSIIFNDIHDSVMRTLYHMPRPLLMILRLVLVIVCFGEIVCVPVCAVM